MLGFLGIATCCKLSCMRISLIVVCCIAVLTACGPEKTDAPAVSPIEAVADDYLHEMLLRFPATGTYYSLPDARHNELFDNSPQALLAWQAREDAWLQRLRDIGAPTEVGSRDWVTYGILFEELSGSIATRVCRSE